MQVIETVVGIAVINAAVSRAGPLEDEVFKLDFRYCQFKHSMPNVGKYNEHLITRGMHTPHMGISHR